MSKNLLYLFVTTLLVFNVLLVTKETQKVRSSLFHSLVTPFNKSVVEKSPERFINDELFEMISLVDSRFYVITIIQERGCGSCIRNEIEAINDLPEEQLNQLLVILVGQNKDALRISGLEIEYLFFESFDEIFNERLDISSLNPFSIVLDKNFIYEVRLVDATKPKDAFLTESYYSYIENLFNH